MKELKAPDKVTQKMTHDGAVTENLATGEVTNISSRDPEVDLSASSEEPASAAVDLAARAAEHHEAHTAKKQAKADDKAVKEGSAARCRPSSRLQFTDEERADPAMKKYIDRSDKAADKLDKAKAAIPTKKVIRAERTFDEAAGKGKTRLRFEEVAKKPNGKLHHNPLSRPVQELKATAHSKIRQVEHENVGVEAGHKGELLAERSVSYTGSKVRAAIRHHKTKPWRDAAKAEQASIKPFTEDTLLSATNDGEKNMFSGLLVCADCGNNLHYHFNQGNPEIKYFNCSNYKGNRGTCTSTHYVRVDFLEQVVLGEIKRLTKFASHYEDDFVKAVMGSSQQSVALDRKLKEKELAALQARDEELDGLFERIYEDNVSGKLSDDRFSKMSRRYEDEQKEISERIKTLRAEMDKLSSKAVTADMFISTVRKYTRAKALTPRMLNELIDRIEVHQAEKIDGEWVQHLTIHYNCVGAIFIPEVFPLPAPEVSVNTRKGVVVNYAPCQVAI